MENIGFIQNVIANYLPYIGGAILAVVFIWTLSEAPVKRCAKEEVSGSKQDFDGTY